MKLNIRILPTKKASNVYLDRVQNTLLNTSWKLDERFHLPHFFYLTLSDAEIKEGDWVIHEENKPFQVKDLSTIIFCEKIIAANDPSLKSIGKSTDSKWEYNKLLPSIQESDLPLICQRYNEKKMVEVEEINEKSANCCEHSDGQDVCRCIINKPKLSSTGSIVIKREENSYYFNMIKALNDVAKQSSQSQEKKLKECTCSGRKNMLIVAEGLYQCERCKGFEWIKSEQFQEKEPQIKGFTERELGFVDGYKIGYKDAIAYEIQREKQSSSSQEKESWDGVFAIFKNPDVSIGTKEAIIRERYNPPTIKSK